MSELEKTPLESDNSNALRESELGNHQALSGSSNEGFHEGINETSLLRKLDLKLLPPLSLLYLLSFLDRSNVANARIEGLVTDLHITGNQYLTALTLYFIGYVIFEASAVSISFDHVESNAYPSAASLAGAFGGILAFGIAKMNGIGGYKGWRWIFIIEGLLTVVISCAAYFFISNYPDTAKFLSDKERSFIQARLTADSDSTRNEVFTWANVKKALFDHKCWLYGLAFHTMSLPLYTLSLFLPSIIKDLGYTSAKAQLLSIPVYALATLLTVLIAYTSERFHLRSPFAIASSLVAIIGYIILITNTHPSKKPGVSYLGTFFAAAGIYPATALALAWPANNVSGQTKRAVASAMQISIGNLGAVLGTQLYRPKTAPRYLLGHGFALGYLCANVAVTAVIWWVLAKENGRREDSGVKGGFEDVGVGEDWEGDDDLRWRFST
ncbi:hypothetical protein EG328_009602 [Venturia inaequalis]|uniref:Uncharacterized protein n=1 Tax=Venturia inaequalis TaxID=5025 RepID=A0A8H3U8N0_VENIN|nr:hypothetical protein EG328_009602 [Venturia inaequalis]